MKNIAVKYVYVVYSRVQDECTLNNMAFDDYTKAAAYADQVTEESGCAMSVVKMPYNQEPT